MRRLPAALSLVSGFLLAGCATTGELAALRTQLKDEQARCAAVASKDVTRIDDLTATNARLTAGLADELKKGQVTLDQLNGHLRLSVLQELLFDSGSAELRDTGAALLKKVVAALKDSTGRKVTIEGHTDDVRIGAGMVDRYPSNWELSTARATTVVRSLQESGLDPRSLGATGFGEFRPVASNGTPEGRQRNRRIDVIVTAAPAGPATAPVPTAETPALPASSAPTT
jgi:chemotaxis protein MotB